MSCFLRLDNEGNLQKPCPFATKLNTDALTQESRKLQEVPRTGGSLVGSAIPSHQGGESAYWQYQV